MLQLDWLEDVHYFNKTAQVFLDVTLIRRFILIQLFWCFLVSIEIAHRQGIVLHMILDQ